MVRFKMAVVLVLITTLVSGCGLFGGASAERERQNEQVTQKIDLGQIVTAEGIGNDNAPVNETNDFDASQDYIYVVADVNYIAEGTTLFARWYRDNDPIEDSSEITADRDYEDTYLEFHLQNLESRFEKGDYKVELLANGNVVGEADFQIN